MVTTTATAWLVEAAGFELTVETVPSGVRVHRGPDAVDELFTDADAALAWAEAYVSVAAGALAEYEQARQAVEQAEQDARRAANRAAGRLEWAPDLGRVEVGERFRWDGWLWEVRQAHTTQADWPPSDDLAALWTRVRELEAPATADVSRRPA